MLARALGEECRSDSVPYVKMAGVGEYDQNVSQDESDDDNFSDIEMWDNMDLVYLICLSWKQEIYSESIQ